jgi:hypothetical protein
VIDSLPNDAILDGPVLDLLCNRPSHWRTPHAWNHPFPVSRSQWKWQAITALITQGARRWIVAMLISYKIHTVTPRSLPAAVAQIQLRLLALYGIRLCDAVSRKMCTKMAKRA